MTTQTVLIVFIIGISIFAMLFSFIDELNAMDRYISQLKRDLAIGNRLVFTYPVGCEPMEPNMDEATIIEAGDKVFKLRYSNGTIKYAQYADITSWKAIIEIYNGDELIAKY